MAEALTKPIDDWTPILVEFHFKHPIIQSLGPITVSGIGFISPSSTTIATLQSYLSTMFQENSFGVREQVTRSGPAKDSGKNFQLWVRWGVGTGIPDTHLKTTSEVQSAFKLMGNKGLKDHLVVVADTVSKASIGDDSKQMGKDFDKAGGSTRERDEECELPPYRK